MKKGFSIIEIVLATAILSLIVVGVTSAWLYGEEASAKSGDRNRAVLLASEGVDIVRNMRDTTAFGSITDGTYGLAQTATGWTLLPSVEAIGNYTRSLVITSPNDSQKNVTMNVSWPSFGGRPETVSFTSIFTNWRANGGYLTIGGSSGGGGGGGGGAPSLSTSGGGGPVGDNHYRLEVRPDSGASGDYVYSINNGATSVISIFSVTDNGSINIAAGQISARDLDFRTPTNIFVSHDFLYVVTNNLKGSMYIFSLEEDPTHPARVGVYRADGVTNSSSALSVYVTNDGAHHDVAYIGYMRSGTLPELIAVDVTDPSNPTTLSSLAVDKSIGDIFVDSSHVAHVAAVGPGDFVGDYELYYMSFDVSSVATEMTLLGSIEIPMFFDGTILELLHREISISVFGTTAYVGGGETTAMLDVTDPSIPVLSESINDSLSYYFALNWRSGYTFAVGASQMSTFYPSSGITIVASNFFTDPSGVAVAYSSNLDFVYTIELSVFHVYTVD